MKIMHFAGGGDIGGAKTHILSLGGKLAEDNDFWLVSFRSGSFSDEARAQGLNVIVAERSWDFWGCLRIALHAVDEHHPDVIHCHGTKANLIGALVKKKRNVPVITTVHSDPRRDYMGMALRQATLGSVNRWALKQMDFYMSVAGGMEKTLIQRGVNPQKIFVIHNGLDFRGSEHIVRQKPLPDADIVVGIAARLTPIKNIPTLLKAFALAAQRNPRLLLRIAGTGEDEDMLKRQAEDLQISDRVQFVGWVRDMRDFFAGVDINVLSSYSETFPYSLLEGAYQHCPAIASNVGGIPELIEHGKTGFLFEPEDAQSFAEYIYRLSVDDTLRSNLAEALYCKANAEFSLDHMQRTQQAAYETVIRRYAQRGERRGAVICGAYGRGNAGDEAILQAIISQMRQIDSDMPLTVMSRNNEQSRLIHKTNAIYTFNILAFIRELRHARLFINGGGSLIQDITSSRSLYFYLFTLFAARLTGCRVIMYGCGIGPLNHRFNRHLAARLLNRNVEIITLRDSVSLQVLRNMRVNKPRILLSADPTVTIMPADELDIEAAFAKEGIPMDIPKIGFCLRTWPGFSHPEYIAEAADYAFRQYGLTPIFIPIELPRDDIAAEQVTRFMHTPYYLCRRRYAVEELIGMLGSMQMVVGMRLHSLIFATSGCAPVIGLSYDVKVESFIRDIGSTHCIPLFDLTADRLIREIDLVVQNGCKRAIEANQRLHQGEEINIAAARELLGMTIQMTMEEKK